VGIAVVRSLKLLVAATTNGDGAMGYDGTIDVAVPPSPNAASSSEPAMNGLDHAQISRLETLLEQRKQALMMQAADDAAWAGSGSGTGTDIESSPADSACVRTLNELVSEASEHRAAQLRVLKHALAKFSDGTYGSCENCGEEIGLSRLNARPEARFCIACQTRMEKARR
jgi:DnaK suppressor protein